MRELGFIDPVAEQRAAREIVRAREHVKTFDVEAPYIAEMARLELVQRFGAAAQNEGYKIYTTIDPAMQTAGNAALREGLLDYDRRHGWRGALAQKPLPASGTPDALESLLDDYASSGPLRPAVVISVADKEARLYARDLGNVTMTWEGMSWARAKSGRRLGPSPKKAGDILQRGDIVYVAPDGDKIMLAQIPEAASALVALAPRDGAIRALVGGFDYFDAKAGKFNRAIQAQRQPGSGFKPFLYSAALEYGFTPSTIVMDAPFVVDDPNMEEAWRPENSSGDFSGPTRLREALVQSKNLVSIRVLQSVGMAPAMSYTERFGFERSKLPRNLTLSLGTLSATPLQVAAGYTVFANANSAAANSSDCAKAPSEIAPRVISAQNAWLMTDMLREVITRGTGRRALALGRNDLAGKTGTTNEARDTWFNGYNPDLVASVWVGFDQSKPLGEGEEGSRTAVPIWVDFMRVALARTPVRSWSMPEGLVQVRISPVTGEVAGADDRDAIFETFMLDRLPAGASQDLVNPTKGDESKPKESAEPLF